MNFISRDTDYATQALLFMAKASGKKNIMTVDEIVEEKNLPGRFLRRILQKLAKEGILVSHKGKKGGFSFLRHPRNIKLTDVIEIFQGKVELTNCLLKGEVCPNVKKCALRKKLRDMSRFLNNELNDITVASLLKEI